MYKNNLIDLTKRREARKKSTGQLIKTKAKNKAPVVDMTERRQAILKDERRNVKRTILTGFIGAFVVVPNKGLMKVDIYDISEGGIAFDMEPEAGHFKKGEEVAMRVYMNQITYFAFIVRIQNSRFLEGEGSIRNGANFLKGTINDEAPFHFVKFIETVSASLERDGGDVMVSNLKK